MLEAGYEKAGYDWEREHWGCKWGAGSAQTMDEWEGHLIYTFDTAWSPPIALLQRIGLQWPMLTFLLDYEEMGVGFKGICKVKGDSIEDHCLSL